MERRRFSQTMASEWQTAFVVSHKMPWCVLLTAVKNYNKSLEKLQDFFFKTEPKSKTKTKCSRPRPRLHDPRPRPRPRLSFLSSILFEIKTLVSRTLINRQLLVSKRRARITSALVITVNWSIVSTICLATIIFTNVVRCFISLDVLSQSNFLAFVSEIESLPQDVTSAL